MSLNYLLLLVGMHGVTYLLVMHFLLLPFYISMWCVFHVCPCLLIRDGGSLCTGAVGPFLVFYLVLFLRYMCAWFVVSAREGCATFHAVYMLFVTNFVWKWIVTMEIGFVCLTSDSLTSFASY